MEFTILVLDIPKSRVGAKLVERYAKDITPEDVRKARAEIAMHQSNNRLETGGRPSKKNRRDLMDFKESGTIDPDEWLYLSMYNDCILTSEQAELSIRRIAYQIYEDNTKEDKVIIAGVVANGNQVAE